MLTSLFPTNVFASATDLEKQLAEINDKMKNLEKVYSAGKAKEKTLNNQISSITTSITKAEGQINTLTKNMNVTANQISQKAKDLEIKQQTIAQKTDVMNQRLRIMYKNGDVGLVEVLLGSNNFGELLSNMDMVTRIYEQDAELIGFMKNEYASVKTQKEELESLKVTLANQKSAVAQGKEELVDKKQEVAEIRDEVKTENKALEKELDALNDTADEISDKIRALQSNDAYVGGTLTWPTPGYTKLSSQYGYRIHPILKTKKLHTGIDIPSPKGTKVVAANDGTVILAAWYGGYGNCVIIDHGGGTVTLYAHNSSLKVKKGDKVKRGQNIAGVGTTGSSTGNHCHFEVRENGEYKDPMGYLK